MALKKTSLSFFRIAFLLSLLSTQFAFGQKFNAFTFSQLPQDYQLFPRENDNQGAITIEGVLTS
ncbi:MAG: hypothetical protein RIQ98_780, partial [Bacteroidota bacterium]